MSETSGAIFVRTQQTPPRAPPMASQGALAWMRDNLFATPTSSLLTLLAIAAIAWSVPPLIRFLFVDAVWSGDGAACRAEGAGACWAYVRAKISFFMYGSYPREEVWRVDCTLALGAVLAVWTLWPGARWRGVAAALLFTALPILGFGLLTGRTPFPTALLPQSALGAAIWWGVAGVLLLGAIGAFAMRRPLAGWTLLGLMAWQQIGGHWNALHLTPVGTNLWGGVFVSLLVASVGIVFSLPLGVLLALGRRSRMPVVKFLCVVLIEFVRGVPLITVLFMANTMLPLFVPESWSPDRLLRPLVGVALFSAVYMAEVVRGGLQAMPKGQYEGAMALGLRWRAMMGLIVVPQALTMVIPGIVNNFIALFKDTTLVAIVGIFDFLRAVDTQRVDPAWSGPTISTTGYVFAAAFYFIFCYGMSRYSKAMERRLASGRAR